MLKWKREEKRGQRKKERKGWRMEDEWMKDEGWKGKRKKKEEMMKVERKRY